MPQAPGKNVLLISLDDAVAYWHYRTVFGQEIQTPNLDRICAQSTAFQSAYCQVPVCSPSRASFMSGISPHHSGITGRDARYLDRFGPENLWPHRLKSGGLYCSTGGKVVLGYRALPERIHRILYSDAPETYAIAPRRRRFKDRMLPGHVEFGGFRGGLAADTEAAEQKLYCNTVADRAIAFLDNYDGAAPFYRGVGFQSPHGPWTTPRRFKEMYDPGAFRQPAAWAGGFTEPDAAGRISPANFHNSSRWFWKQSLRNYMSSLSYADAQIGRVWDALKASRFADSTLVVIVSDHGLHLGERNRFSKGGLWEQVANVPLIIHDPATPEARVVTDPVGLIDIGNTVMDYLDLPAIPGSLGQSLMPQLSGTPAPDRAIPTVHGDNASIRKGRYRFTRYACGTTEMFDLSTDWWQKTDLGPGHAAYGDMQQAHAACCSAHGLPPAASAA